MVAEKLDKIDVAEARLKRLIELTPENAQALNALGYTLVDRTPRAAEGYALIEKAYKLSPEDPFIQDSMGWALYRMGKLDDAETVPAPRDGRAGPTPRSPRTWAKCSGSRATAPWRGRSGSRSSNPRRTMRC